MYSSTQSILETCLAEQLLEERPWQHVPCNGVRDCSEYPVELAQGGLPVCLLARDAVYEVLGEALMP